MTQIHTLPRNTPAARLPARLMFGIFFTCFLVYSIFWSGHHYSIDGVIIFQYAKSVLFHGSFVMNPPVRWGGNDIPQMGSAMGMSLAYVPILAFLAATLFVGNSEISAIPYDPSQDNNPALLRNPPYLFSSFLNPVLTALTAVVLFSLCKEVGLSNKKSTAAALVFGIASPAAVYAKSDFNQPLASLCLLLSLLFILRARNGIRDLVIAGIFLGYGVFTRPELLPISLIVFMPLVYLDPGLRGESMFFKQRLYRLLVFLAPLLAFTILNQYTNVLRYGSWFSIGYYGSSPSSMFTLNPANISAAILGNLTSPGRGILLFFPICLLGLVGISNLLQRRRLLAILLGVLIFGLLVLYSMFIDWPGGVSWGPRYLIPLMPYLTLLAFTGLDALEPIAKRLSVLLAAFLIAVGWINALQGLLFDYQGFYRDPQKSPLLSMWNDFWNPSHYDIFWLQNTDPSRGTVLAVFLVGLVLLGFIICMWLDYFRQPNLGGLPQEQLAESYEI